MRLSKGNGRWMIVGAVAAVSMSLVSQAHAAGVTRTLTTSGVSDWTTATWTNGAPDSTSAGDLVTYAPTVNGPATTTLDASGVVFGQIRGFQTFVATPINHWVINQGTGTTFTLDNTGGLINPFGNFDSSITSSAVGSLLTVNPNIVIQNTNLSIGAIQNLGVIVNGNITASSARTLTLVNNSNSSGGVFEINGSIGATGSAIAIQTSHTTNGGFSFPIIIKGALGPNVSSLTHNAATDLRMDYSVTSSELIDNAIPISLGYGSRYYQFNNTSAATTETVASVGLAGGQSTLTLNGGLNNTYALLDIGSFSRSNNATALVRGTNLGLAAGASVAANRINVGSGLVQIGTNTSSLGAGAGGTDKQLTIVPYLIGGGGTGGATSVGSNFLTLDTNATTGGLRLLGTNEQTTVALAVTGDNVSTTGVVATSGTKTFNSLRATGSAVSSLTGDNTGTLNITSGALASMMSGANGDFDLAGFTSVVFGTTGANEAIITNTNTTAGGLLTIASPISTATLGGGLTKAGLGVVVLAADNTYTGTTTINQGVLQVGNGSTGSLNGTSTIVTAAGDPSSAEARRGELSLYLANDGVLSNTIVNNGAISKSVGTNVNGIAGGISGPGVVNVNLASATLAFSGTAKSYSGATTVTNGALRAVGDVLSPNSLIRFNPALGITPILQLRADSDTSFQTGGVNMIGSLTAGLRSMTIDVDQATSGNSDKLLTLGGTFTIDSIQGEAQKVTVNVTGANGYGLGVSNTNIRPNSSGGGWVDYNVSAPGGLEIASITIPSGGPVTVGFIGSEDTTVTGNLVRNTQSMTLNQNGSAKLTLEGAAVSSGAGAFTFNLNAGALNVNNANALGSAGTRTLNIAGGTLDNTSGGDITTVNPAININGDFTFGGTNNLNLGTGATTLGTAAGTTRTITANGTTIALTIGGVIANGTTANSLTKAGTGTLILGGANTFDGLTTVSGGTLRIAANDRIANASDLLLDGGTFDTGGFAETMDLLALSNNSAIEFGTGTSIVNFAALGTFDTTKTLQLLGWSGLDTGSGTDQLFVGTSAALSASELAAIQFVNPTNYLPGTYVATQLSSGEIVAVIPEPASLGLLAMAGLSLLRRRRA